MEAQQAPNRAQSDYHTAIVEFEKANLPWAGREAVLGGEAEVEGETL